MWYRLVAHAKTTPLPIIDHRIAPHLWGALRAAFPRVVAAVLMPTYVDLIPWGKSAKRVRARLARVLADLGRLTKGKVSLPEWEPIELPAPITDPDELARQVVEVNMAPCRERPLGPFDVSIEPIPLEYPHSPAPTALPRPYRPDAGFPEPTIERVLAAAAAATRAPKEAVRGRTPTRSLFLHLAWEVGLRDQDLLGRICGIGPKALKKYLKERDEQALSAGLLCLGDDRLLYPVGCGFFNDPSTN